MASSRRGVWLITGASSSLGYRLCLTVIARRELVVAFAASQQDVDRLQTAGAYGIKMDSEMSFEEIKRKIREAVSFYGRIDFLVNNPEYDPPGSLNAYGAFDAYWTNIYCYSAIQVTKAVAQECSVSQIVVISLGDQPGHSPQDGSLSAMRDNVEATAHLLATEYRSRGVGVLLANLRHLYPASGSRNSADDTRATAELIIGKVRKRGPSEPGLCVT